MNNGNLRPPWKPGESGNPNGRPKSRVKDTLVQSLKLAKKKDIKAYLSAVEVKEWEEYLLSASSEDLVILGQNPQIPIYVRTIARALMIDLKNGKTTTLDKLRDRVVGKEVQKLELTGADGADLIPARRLSEEEAAKLLKQLENDY